MHQLQETQDEIDDLTKQISPSLFIDKSKINYMKKRFNIILFLLFNALTSFGASYNNTFQSYIKEQITKEYNIDQSQFSKFLLITTIPVTILPLLTGPALVYFGNRKGVFFFTFSMLLGMSLCFISLNAKNFFLLIFGKTIHNIGSELVGISQAYYYSKWFDAQNMAKAFTIGVFFNKIASSSSGVIYPQLYDVTQNLNMSILVGSLACLLSFLSALGVIYMDRKGDQSQLLIQQEIQTMDNVEGVNQRGGYLNRNIFKQFYFIYWIYVIQNVLMFGSFYGFQNYLQSVIIKKFKVGETLAGQLISIPYWIAFSSPLFGIITDMKGRRIIGLFMSASLAFGSVLYLYLLPTGENLGQLIFALILFGLFLSLMTVFIYPTLPFVCSIEFVNIGFGIMLCFRNSGLAILNIIGDTLLKADNSGYQNYLMCYFIIFLTAVCISILMFIIDLLQGGKINSKKPQKYQNQ